jgi:hypothetical protein
MKMQTSPQRRLPLIASVAVIVVLVGGFAYYYVTATGTIASLNSSISSQQGVIAGQASTISGQSSTIQAQSSTINSQSSDINTLRANVTAYQALVVSLHGLISADTAQIATLNANLTADTTTIATLNVQIVTAEALISNLTTTVDLQASHILVNAHSETIYGNTATNPVPYSTFSPTHAGYILLQVSAATIGWFAEIDYAPTASNPSGGIYATFTFLATSSPAVGYVIVPVVPGSYVSFWLWSATASYGTCTVTATYFY